MVWMTLARAVCPSLFVAEMSSAFLAADENLSLRDFVTKHATLPTEPSARQAAQMAIATLSSTTTVGAFLGLSTTVAANSIFSGIVAQTHLAELLSTSSTPLSAQLQTEFIQKYAAYQGTMQDFWTQLTDRWQRTAGVGGEREKKTAPLSYRLARIPIPRHL